MFFYLIYTFFSLFNAIALFYVYIPIIKPKVAVAIALHKILGDWYMAINAYVALVALVFKQWLNETCVRMGPNKYRLKHMIGGKVVKLIVTKTTPEVLAVTHASGDKIHPIENAMAYFRYQQAEITATDLGFDNGSVAITTPQSHTII